MVFFCSFSRRSPTARWPPHAGEAPEALLWLRVAIRKVQGGSNGSGFLGRMAGIPNGWYSPGVSESWSLLMAYFCVVPRPGGFGQFGKRKRFSKTVFFNRWGCWRRFGFGKWQRQGESSDGPCPLRSQLLQKLLREICFLRCKIFFMKKCQCFFFPYEISKQNKPWYRNDISIIYPKPFWSNYSANAVCALHGLHGLLFLASRIWIQCAIFAKEHMCFKKRIWPRLAIRKLCRRMVFSSLEVWWNWWEGAWRITNLWSTWMFYQSIVSFQSFCLWLFVLI